MLNKTIVQTVCRWALPLLAILFITGCQKMGPIPPPWKNQAKKKTIWELASSDGRFSLLKAAVARAGLVPALNDKKARLTVFAPTDDAFKAAGYKTVADIAKAPADALKSILLYHFISDELFAAEIPQASNTPVRSENGQPLYVTRTNAGNVFINGVKVIIADIDCSNGVIHVVDRVLIPAPGTIVALAAANPNLSLLVAAVLRAGASGTDVAAILGSDGPFTVFAPTNQAFVAAGLPSVEAINTTDPSFLLNILAYHVLVGTRVFSSDLVNGASVETFQGGSLKISLGSTATVKGNSNTAASKIILTDLVATNGVVHVIDQVLLP
ncbi:fasciclin domain-containing protein [Flavihumibacter sp. CACIAM 22H1]|uniref:fasciclin domain-containing protein n=1 Tax=Flavihumibacter sp. CACIAM 22H1 TaxID=1812911 RepID=UPI0007A93397|nr:fasciclin domain-containing protein [Flavihumibacter sp. CACIAM 22H1]KYP16257.1 MAG: hypothetical protein A1D16_20150 [Flavihumibacter sp. CACIAM 22H1]